MNSSQNAANAVMVKKAKLSLEQALEAHKFMCRRGLHTLTDVWPADGCGFVSLTHPQTAIDPLSLVVIS
jgi:hypothetical protein